MKYRLLAVLLMHFSFVCAMHKTSIIVNSSYFIVHGKEQAISLTEISGVKHATFYDALGNALKVVSAQDEYKFWCRLDRSAGKPKPVRCGVVHIQGAQKYISFVVFLDKDGNYIKSYPYEQAAQSKFDFAQVRDLDLHNCNGLCKLEYK